MNCGCESEKPQIALRLANEQLPLSSGRPLDSSIRSFMEQRFRVGFRRVRIHTDGLAAGVARRLNARAFTRGTDIYFASGQYAPHDSYGKWLLAHELVHVTQQALSGVSEAGGAQAIGNAHSCFEMEANTIADEVLGSERISPVRPDNTRAIRRLISIPSSGQITVISGTAVPAVTLSKGGVSLVCNLTTGFNAADPDLSTDAFTAEGAVDVMVDNATEVAALTSGSFRFAFIQIAKMHFGGHFWAGKKSSEGSVGMVISSPPAWPANQLVSLDSQSPISPFASPSRPIITDNPSMGRILVRVSGIKTGDHPTFGAPIRIKNKKAVAENHLFHMREHVEYFTVLVVMDPANAVIPLAHFRWENECEAKILWRGGNPVPVQTGKITFDAPVSGAPADPAVRALLASPKPPHTNDLHRNAERVSVTGGNPSNFALNDKWFANVPADFFL